MMCVLAGQSPYPERARWLYFARSGNQSQREIRFILPAHGAKHIIKSTTDLFKLELDRFRVHSSNSLHNVATNTEGLFFGDALEQYEQAEKKETEIENALNL